ncbi:MAG: glycosyltransferase family 2 protein [Kordiimonadaceae bacterium]|jgi:polyisoprenyl-phosphate glycosyltransferase|nr:glycosyltransferase family 2 protein [Kordiimonadaceae bacterium]
MLPTLSIILPCYNEGVTLDALVNSYLELINDRDDCELVLVDNGSSDRTWEKMNKLKEKFPLAPILLIRVEVNQGYGYGLMQGLDAASGSVLSWSHADLQCPPNDVFKLYDEFRREESQETIFGKGHRVNNRGNSSILTNVQTLLARLILGHRMVEINAQPKMFHKTFYKTWKAPPKGYELDIYAYFHALRQGLNVISIDVHFLDRQEGESKWAYSLLSRLTAITKNIVYLFILRVSR